MHRAYFYLNAFLYAGLALWCTLSPAKTAQGIGYTELNRSGHSEYLVIYGGLQIGLALFYAYLGYHAETVARLGALFSVLLYAPIVAYRFVTVIRFSPVAGLTLGTAALESFLLLGALGLFFRTRI